MNKIEGYKREKDGLDVLEDLPRFVENGWESIPEGDKERLKWLGVFLRRQTPGRLMMRLRMANGVTNASQLRALGEVASRYGKGFADITTRQQVQLRWFEIGDVPQIWSKLSEVGLTSLQTGMDNIRGVVGCPVAGLTPDELFDASPVVRELTSMFLGNKEFTNLPRKMNITITGCTHNCTGAESQDIALTPATKAVGEETVVGFNVAVGGKMGSGGYRAASPLDVFVLPEAAAGLTSQIILLFRDHGSREARNRNRLAFLVEAWGPEKFREELERRSGRQLSRSGQDAFLTNQHGHRSVMPQRQAGRSSVCLAVPAGRITAGQLHEAARLSEDYGDGEIRLTTTQNVVIANVPDESLAALKDEPLLRELPFEPSEIMRGLVSCTGKDYCHFSLIETKELAIATARELERRLGGTGPVSMHWSGCPNGCGNHAAADIGLLGKRLRVDGEIVDAVDVFLGPRFSSPGEASPRILENIRCADLPDALVGLFPVTARPVALEASAGKQELRHELD